MTSRDFLTDLFTKGEIGAAIAALLENARHSEYAAVQQEICTQASRFNTVEREFRLGKLDTDEYNKEKARINAAVWDIIQQSPTAVSQRKNLSDYHRHTCDRAEQNEAFGLHYDGSRAAKKHFFALVGGEYQAHDGLFRRIGYDLEGRLHDYLNPDLPTACTVLKLDLTFDTSSNPDVYKQNVIKSLCAAAHIAPNAHAPLLDKNLAFILSHSPALRGLKSHDFACILLTISQYDWDARMTPVIVRWFIREFCAAELPEHSPTLLFFFALKYEETDDPLRTEVQQLVGDNTVVQALPELGMVPLRDIQRWFERYKHIEPDTRKRQEKLRSRFTQTEFYMEDVELELRRIIDEYNQT